MMWAVCTTTNIRISVNSRVLSSIVLLHTTAMRQRSATDDDTGSRRAHLTSRTFSRLLERREYFYSMVRNNRRLCQVFDSRKRTKMKGKRIIN